MSSLRKNLVWKYKKTIVSIVKLICKHNLHMKGGLFMINDQEYITTELKKY